MYRQLPSKLLTGALYLVSLLPFPVLYGLAGILNFFLSRLIGYRRTVIDQNLSRAFPDSLASERQYIRKKYYRYLADLIIETVKLITLSEREVHSRMNVINPELISDYFKKGRSVLGVLGHYGNWELGALRFSQLYTEKRIIVYKPLSSQNFNALFLQLRSRFGATLIKARSAARTLAGIRSELSVTVMVCDQTPARPEVQYFTEFLHQPTAVYLGPEKLAKLTDSVVVFCDIRRLKRGYYECRFIPLCEQPRCTAPFEITNTHVSYLESVIKDQPEYWLWSHRRWKFDPEEFKESTCPGQDR